MRGYILASASPRRVEICGMAGLSVTVCPAPESVEPPIDKNLPPDEAVLAVARAKAQAVAVTHPHDTVIGADTSVWVDGEVLGKPADEREAADMLRRLSGRTHRVRTAVWVVSPARSDGFCDTAEVTFYPMSEREVAAYIATGEPMDKAGAYGVQGLGMRYVEKICGDFYTVMGLSGGKLQRFLQNFPPNG